ncbi:MAG: transglutaminase domain-containing protein [Lachnospiraceae bacterium]|nr:transglutaminase domain-containing protein [Lachnospiraceae bacterium]
MLYFGKEYDILVKIFKRSCGRKTGENRRLYGRDGEEAVREKVNLCLRCLGLILALSLFGCSGLAAERRTEGGTDRPGKESSAISGQPGNPSSSTADAEKPADFVPYQAPEFAGASFHEEQAQGDDRVRLDLSAVNLGYVAVSARSDVRLKFQVIKGEIVYTYDLPSDGAAAIFPVQSGDGVYTFQVMENTVDTRYAVIYTADSEVLLEDEYQPFLRPSEYVSYGEDSACVRKAAELAESAEDAPGVVAAVFDYICSTVVYDKEKAQSVQSGYLPVPDETLASGKGICFDYASLAAAMLRSQGIPTKVIFGYVSPDDIYHAWNMFYTEQTGWISVEYEVKAGSWNRLDLTFSAGGAGNSFVGDGTNYADVYVY